MRLDLFSKNSSKKPLSGHRVQNRSPWTTDQRVVLKRLPHRKCMAKLWNIITPLPYFQIKHFSDIFSRLRQATNWTKFEVLTMFYQWVIKRFWGISSTWTFYIIVNVAQLSTLLECRNKLSVHFPVWHLDVAIASSLNSTYVCISKPIHSVLHIFYMHFRSMMCIKVDNLSKHMQESWTLYDKT